MDKARFMGRMAAGVCHDLANVLATVQQAAGLLEDYLALARKESLKTLGLRPQFRHHEKFTEIIGQIQAQVNRGQDLCEGLGRLAHSPDVGQGPVEMGAAAGLLAGLCARAARRCRTAVEVTPGPERLLTGASLIDVLAGTHAVLLEMLERARNAGPVRLVPGRFGEASVGMDVLCPGLSPDEAASVLQAVAGPMTGSAEVSVVEGGVRLAYVQA